jgi:hypothetical protein
MDRARHALDDQQVEQLIAEARTSVDEGHLAEGAELARRALGIRPDNAAASALLDEITAIERDERDRAVRERAIALAIDKCRDAALAGDAEGVVAAAEEVLALDGTHAEARDLMAQARSLIDAREREREAERRAREVVDRARREFHDGLHDDSIARLERYTPSHPVVSRALDELRAERAEFERLKREAERQRQREAEEAAAERQLQIAVGLSRAAIALAEQRFADASSAVDAVLALDPEHPRALALQGDIAAAVEARQRQEEGERLANEAIKSAETLFDAGDPVAAMELLNNHPGDLPRVTAALARLQLRHRTTSEREVDARRAEHDRRAADAIASAQARIGAGEHGEALEELEQFAPSHPDVDRVLRDLRREIERRREAQWVAEQTATAGAEIDAGRFEDALSRLNRLPQTSRDQASVSALLARAEAAAAAANEAQRERHTATAQLADAESAANGWDPARTLAILETLETRVKARADLQDLTPRIDQLSAFARRRQDLLRLLRESSAQLRSGALQGALATVDRALAEEPQLPGAAELRGRIEAAIAEEGQERARDEAAASAVAAARKLALDGRLDAGIRLLEQADTGHAAVAVALTDLRRERADLERRERELREQDEKRVQARRAEIAALLKRARKAKSPDAAIALLRSALELDPENADAQEALAKYQEQRRDRFAGPAAGAAASRSKTFWRVGGAASAIVALIVFGYVIRQRPQEPANPPVTVTPPPGATTPTSVAPAPPTTTIPAPPPLPPSTVPPTTAPARGERPGQTTPQASRGKSTAAQLPPSTQSVPPTQVPPTTVAAPTTTVPSATTSTTTTTTTVPPTTTVAPAPSISETAARQVIDAYYAAYRARDFNALRAIFPAASDLDRKRIEALRKDFEPCDYNVRKLDVTAVTPARAFVTVDVTSNCRPRIRAPSQPINASPTFELGKSGDGRWIIVNGP